MALLRQIFNSQRYHTLNVQASADDLDALKGLMEGKIEEWDMKATGGTETAMPEKLNPKRFVCKKDLKKCSFRIHHLDPNKSNVDLDSFCVGKFDVGFYDGAEKCDECYEILG